MWHEARRQEKKIRKVIVDYRKRSERRHLYYERIKQDPTKFLQVHGRKSKIHIDGTVAAEADNNNHMMPWQGDSTNMIDRFDVRTHLDFYRDPVKTADETLTEEDRKCSFERYRVLIWNEYKKISEHQHLRQIHIEEQFPEIAAQQKQKQDALAQKQLLAQNKASIGYDYDSGGKGSSSRKGSDFYSNQHKDDESDEEEEDDYDISQDLEEIPPLSEINMEAITAMDEIGVKKYALRRGGFGDSLLDDQDHIDKVGAAKALESEKQKFSGRKSRRERRLLKDERLRGREITSLSYVRQESSNSTDTSGSSSSSSESDSYSSSDEESTEKKSKNKIEFITSFGGAELGNDNAQSLDVKRSGNGSAKKKRREKSSSSSPEQRRSRSRSPHRSYSKYSSRYRRSRSSSYDNSRSRSRRSRSRSRSRSRDRRRSRSRSYERRSRTDEYRHRSSYATAKISSTSQGSENLLRSISKNKTSEEKAAALKKLTPQQKLKIKMQRALNKQLKVDRSADMEKRMIKQQELLEREDDLREMSRKIRKRERAGEEYDM